MTVFCNQNLSKKTSGRRSLSKSNSLHPSKLLALVVSVMAGFGLFIVGSDRVRAMELVPIVETETGINQYINADTISHLGEIAEYEVYTKLPSPHVQGLAMVRTLVTGNCDSGETTSWGVVAFDADGNEIINKKFASGENHGKVKPGSLEEKALILACEYPEFFSF